jgi:hypothetical protein
MRVLIPVPCTTLRQRRTNSTLGFRVSGSLFVRPTSELEPPVDNPSFQEFVAQHPPHIRRTMQHSNQDEISSHAFADWLSAGRPTFCGTDGGMKDDLGTFGFAWAS